jgi:hypothetical protein
MAHTSKEPYPVSSAPFTIEPQLEISHMINPPNPDGANNWYINEPMTYLYFQRSGKDLLPH